ncbi:hypothetical protein SAMN02745121_06503 [Nannocystis exedens]|uniref:Uncharacterized protein n=1 Tax=Nannocystis exedens TaxID=54 RepID=A0A1I2F871_9BACT|nr:hypothetical protein [Nannocystis exedens]PCC73035.1 hypothetical protein NAEX_06121 [Nannocystis exedens]SFF01149.1 hypothetical protein SAMN02745121_06503 [Nannocystis exedens]
MSTPLRIASWLLAAVALIPHGASARPGRAAAPLSDPAVRAAVEWRPVEVVPVALTDPAPWTATPPPEAAKATSVVVGPASGAVIRLGSLAVLQVRAEPVRGAGRPAPLKFWRRSGAAADGRAAVLEPALEVAPGTWLLEHPPGGAGDWLVSAAEPTRITALAPVPRTGELIWEHVIGAALEWIERGGPPPPLPDLPAFADLRRELLADAAVAAALRKSDPKDMSLQAAVKAWRGAAAVQRITAMRPPGRPTFALETAPRPLPGAAAVDLDGRPFQRTAGGRSWDLRMTGPGVAWISARLLGQDPKASISVHAGGRRLARERLAPETPCPPDAAECRVGGPERDLAIPLAPGEHTYRLRVDGDAALLQVRVGQTLERFATTLRREGADDLLRAGRRALARTRSPRAALVDALLAQIEGRPPPATRRPTSPPLALTFDWLQAQQDGLAPARRRQLAWSLARTADAVKDRELAARGRAAGIELLEGTDDAGLARRLLGPRPSEAPARALAAAARLLDGPPLPLASPMLALFERARRLDPYDADLRAAYRDHWQATRWSLLLPSHEGPPPLVWIERLPPDPARAPTSASLWTWPNGHAQTVMAPTLPEAPERPALLRLYARTDASLTVTVDDERWRTLPLAQLELLELALPAGPHALTVAGASGSEVWSSLAPTPPRAPDARLLRLWRADAEQPARFVLPGEPAHARVDIRALASETPTRVELTVKTDTGLRRQFSVELRPVDATAIPLDGSPRVGPPTSVLIPLDLRARALEVLVTEGGPAVAVSAAVRAPGLREPLAGDPPKSPAGHVRSDTSESPEGHAPQDTSPAAAGALAAEDDPLAAEDRATGDTPADSLTRPTSAPAAASVPADSQAQFAPAPVPAAGQPGPAPIDEKPVPEDSRRPEPPLAALERASRGLLERPHDPELLIARAGALLDLDQRPYALSDWAQVAAHPLPPALQPRALALGRRIEALGAPSHIDVTTDVPVLVAPALAAAGLDDLALARLAPAAARAREAGPAAGLAVLDELVATGPATPAVVGAGVLGAPAPGDMSAKTSSPPTPASGAPDPKAMSAGSTASPAPKAMSAGSAASPAGNDIAPRTPSRAADPAPVGSPGGSPGSRSQRPGAPAPKALSLKTPARPAADPAELALRAALLDAAARPAEAFRAWHRVYAATERWQVGLAGVKSALAALDEPTTSPEGAGLAYGLALRVRPAIRTPWLDRLTNIAGERSRWSHLILSEERGSREHRDLPKQPAPATINADARAALLAAPFPTKGALMLRPGVPVLIDLARGHDALGFQLWCREVRPELGGVAPTVRFWMGEELLHTQPVAADTLTLAEFAVPARDAVTLELDDGSHAHLCLARLRRPEARQVARTDRWHVARPGRPVEFIVLGPTTVQVEVHGRPASDVSVAVARGSEPYGPARSLGSLSGHVPSGLSKRTKDDLAAHPPVQVLTLADSGPLRMRLAPGVGPALVRVHQRLDAEPAAAPPRPPRRHSARLPQEPAPPAPVPHPPLAVPPTDRRVQKFGTPYVDLHLGTDDLEDSDDLRPRASGIVRLGWARELLARRLWIEVNPELRPREDTALVAGGRLSFQAFFPRAGLRAWVSAAGLVQTEHQVQPWSLRGEGRIDRPTWLAPRLQLLPGLDLAYRYQSLDSRNAFPRGELHPRVYQWYVEDHPLVFRPTLDLRVVAWQDARVVVGADMMPNSDFRSVDQVSMHAGIAGALALYGRVVPEFALDYEASLRLKDPDRDKTYLRSRLLAGLGVGFWLTDGVRLAFGVRNNLYLSALYPARNGLDLWLRLDLPLGRGLRDFGPLEMPFRAAREHRMWRQEPTP